MFSPGLSEEWIAEPKQTYSSLVANERGRFECPYCDADFTSTSNVATHVKKSCPTLFPEKKKPKKEHVYMKNEKGRYECPHCGIDFARDHGMVRHMENSCTVLYPDKVKPLVKRVEYPVTAAGRYDCPHCDANFSSSYNVQPHIDNCCPAKFPWKEVKSSTKKQKKAGAKPGSVQTNKKVVPKKKAVTVPALTSLYRRTVEGKYICPHCNAEFTAAPSVKTHIENSCKALFPAKKPRDLPPSKEVEFFCNPQGRYECPHCDSDFTTSYNVKTHLEKSCTTLFPDKKKARQKAAFFAPNHQGRFECPYCDLDFASSRTTASHVESRCPVLFPKLVVEKLFTFSRNADGRYECPYCPAHFARDHGAQRHVENTCAVLFPDREQINVGDGGGGGGGGGAAAAAAAADGDGDEESIIGMRNASSNADFKVPIGSRVQVFWEGRRYPGTIMARAYAYDVEYDDGSHGENLTVDAHLLEPLDAHAAQKRKMEQEDECERKPRKIARLSNGAASEEELELVRKHAIEVATLKETAAAAMELVKNREWEVASLKKTVSSMNITIDAVQKLAKFYEDENQALKNTVAAAELRAVEHAEKADAPGVTAVAAVAAEAAGAAVAAVEEEVAPGAVEKTEASIAAVPEVRNAVEEVKGGAAAVGQVPAAAEKEEDEDEDELTRINEAEA